MTFDLGCYVHFDSRILDLWTWAEKLLLQLRLATYSLLHLCPPHKKKLGNELRIQDQQDQLRQSQGFRSSCLKDVHVVIRVAKVTLLVKLLNINEKQA